MSGHWFCCDCNYGPHNADIQSCLRCASTRCSSCVSGDVPSRDSLHCSHEMSPYPDAPVKDLEISPNAMKMSSFSIEHDDLVPRPSLHLSHVHNHSSGLSSFNNKSNKVYGQTYLYICCQCNDGPKLYNNQPRCVMCNHVACSSCHEVK